MTAAQVSPAPDFANQALHDLFDRWAEYAGAGRIPSIDELNFDELVEEYPSAVLIEVEQRQNSSPRYRYARVGPGHKSALGREIQGYSIDELVAPQQVAHFENIYSRIVSEVRPHYWMRMNSLVGSELRTFERLLVPVSRDGESVDALIGVWVWIDMMPDAA